MTDEDALKATIREHPHEDTPRLMYADWLEEHGERPEQAQFIREKRVGEHVGKLREAARNASANTEYLDRQANTVTYPQGAKARKAARMGEHLKASELHDKVGDWYFHHSIDNQLPITRQWANIMHDRNGAMGHYLAAHYNEAVTHDLGSKASHASVAALVASAHTNEHSETTNSLPNNQWNEVFRAREFSAAHAHRLAADYHEGEGNHTTAARHRKIAELHDRRGQDLADYNE